MDDAPMLPMPELQEQPLRKYAIAWRMSGTVTVVGTSPDTARAEAAALEPKRLVLFSDAVAVAVDEPKEVAGE